MKKFLLSSAALLALASTASAADLAARPYTKAPPLVAPIIYNWTGFYIGGNVGYGWNDRDVGFAPAGNAVSTAFFAPAFAVGGVPSALRPDAKGVIGGGQIGYNWQFDRIVLGLEADFQGSDLRGSQTTVLTVPPLLPITTSASQRLDWFGTVRGRVGFAADTVLFYATGGFAYGQVRDASEISSIPLNQINTQSSTNTRTGYTVGGGIEWAFAPNWSLKGEYLYIDLGSHSFATTPSGASPAGASVISSFRDQFQIARVGINYKWGGPVVARY